jgi:ABC-type nitrate/sulfonate/bicarbonate transport system substrate-binding protein
MIDRVRLMCWCPTSVSGAHLPAFAAAEGGLFAEQGLEVEFVDCLPSLDWTLQGFTTRVKAVAAGEVDFALTGVAYLLAAQSEAGGRLPARFAAVSHQRNAIVGVVRGDSELMQAADLAGSRVASWIMPWFTQEYAGALEQMGVGPPVVVETQDPGAALGRGEVDVIPTWMDMTLAHRRNAGFPIRAIPLDIEVYPTGLVAADRLPDELVFRMREAFIAGYALHRDEPELGTAAFRRRFPHVSEEHIAANWALFEPYAFGGAPPGSMTADRWQATIDYTGATHGLCTMPGERIYRPELLAPAVDPPL